MKTTLAQRQSCLQSTDVNGLCTEPYTGIVGPINGPVIFGRIIALLHLAGWTRNERHPVVFVNARLMVCRSPANTLPSKHKTFV